jgi:hypothetical protein
MLTVVHFVKELLDLLWDPKTQYHVQNNTPIATCPESDNLSTSHTLLQIQFNVILPRTPKSSLQAFQTKIPYEFLISSCS